MGDVRRINKVRVKLNEKKMCVLKMTLAPRGVLILLSINYENKILNKIIEEKLNVI